ncbi:hypothetical protein KV112_20650 [Mycolicibacter sp. MYC123]|uniref:Peptidase S1 domain-containing protein n=1 Tax=[Mycobacterium] zoologicum TaxID=2872311 RepID=A0ABU5YPX8_9MYCO|nr:hypothetical protein [Mycolicibacter sp. MYC123]MEB3052123.1 hypothetical protein [Mycolicibacter sp. MYC123]
MKGAALGFAAAVSCAVLAAAPAQANPNLADYPAPAVAPGVAIATYAPDRSPAGFCTVGWLVHDADGQAGLLTAGHCDHGGGGAYQNATDGTLGVGRFTHHIDEGDRGEDADIAVLGIGNYRGAARPVATDTRIIGIRPTSAPANPGRLSVGQWLCHYGAATHLACGPITAVLDTKVIFAAPARKGDSGGPVYYRNSDGTATPVGVAIRVEDGGDGTVAELIGPWLERWHLTVDTTPVPAAPVGWHR